MKFNLPITLVTLSIVLASCGHGRPKKVEPVMTAQDSVLVLMVELEVDSILTRLNGKLPTLFITDVKTGRLTLNEQVKKIKPDYLLPLSKVAELQTLSQKNIALGMYSIDKAVAELYGMSVLEYNAVITRLLSDLNIAALPLSDDSWDWKSMEAGADFAQRARSLMANEKIKGRLNFVVGRITSLFVESIFVYAQAPDIYTSALTNDDVADIVYRLDVLTDVVNRITAHYYEMRPLKVAFDVLRPLNEVSTKEQFVVELKKMAPDIAKARNKLLN